MCLWVKTAFYQDSNSFPSRPYYSSFLYRLPFSNCQRLSHLVNENVKVFYYIIVHLQRRTTQLMHDINNTLTFLQCHALTLFWKLISISLLNISITVTTISKTPYSYSHQEFPNSTFNVLIRLLITLHTTYRLLVTISALFDSLNFTFVCSLWWLSTDETP